MTFNYLHFSSYRGILAVLGLLWGVSASPAWAAAPSPMPDKIVFGTHYRDFPYYGLTNWQARVGNPYFNNEMDVTGPNTRDDKTGRLNNVVLWDTLDANGKPQFAGFMDGTTTWAGGTYVDLLNYFNEWFSKDLGSAYHVASRHPAPEAKMTASARTDKGIDGKVVKGMAYRYQWIQTSSVGDPGFPGFFPIDNDQGWGTTTYVGSRRVTGYDNKPHNFSFTAELTASLTLPKNTEAVSVASGGDDDLWVFINGKLVTGRVFFKGIRENVGNNIAYDVRPGAVFRTVPAKIVPGEAIKIKIFFAERRTPGSSVRFILDVYTNDKLNGASDNLKISAKAVPVSEPAKVWFSDSDAVKKAVTVE